LAGGEIRERESLVSAARPGYRQVAATLREQILGGVLQAGDAIPGQNQLSRDLGADVAVVNRAVALLEQEGLVAVGQGRRTVVRARRGYRATVSVPAAGLLGPGEHERMAAALAAAADAEPSVSEPAVTVTPDRVVFSVIVEAPDQARAGVVAFQLATAAWGDGWDLDGASGTQEPAG
jgi:DNA-binding transcriptional MocR family regulator